jgi:putative ABC transport system substrate-binding protein
MNRRDSLNVLAAGLAFPLWARAQKPAKMHKVGILSTGTDPSRPVDWDPFVDAMRALGYIEGKNLVLIRAFAGGKTERLDSLVSDLVEKRVDVIVTTGMREIRALKPAAGIPAIFTVVTDPVAEGIVQSLARPGGNATGFTLTTSGLHQKYVELLTESVPSAARIAVIVSAPNPTPPMRDELEAAARIRRVDMIISRIKDGADIEPLLARLKKEGVGGLIAPLDGVTNRYRNELARAAEKVGLPAIYAVREYVLAGGLMSYGPSWPDIRRRAADYVDRILKGAKPADLPVQQPTRFELVLNLKAAKALGLTFPPTVLVRADELIQ